MTDRKHLDRMLNELDDEELLLREVFLAGTPSDKGLLPKDVEGDDPLATGVFLNEEVVFDEEVVHSRENILKSLSGRTFTVRYRWYLWDSADISEAYSWDNCRVFIEDKCMLLYDGEGELKFRLPLDRVMFRARESMITVAWFDQEEDSIYYTLELNVDLF